MTSKTSIVGILVASAVLAACGTSSPSTQNGDDAGDAAMAAPVCPPAPLGAWQPPPYNHANKAQANACTAALMSDFFTACLGASATQTSCDQDWGTNEDAVHAKCHGCLLTANSAGTWGAVVAYSNGTVSANVGGCIELLDSSRIACATLVQEADVCEHQLCDVKCPVMDDASFANWKGCIGAAARGDCKSYVDGAACQNAEADGGLAASCVGGMSFQDVFTALGGVFCGGG